MNAKENPGTDPNKFIDNKDIIARTKWYAPITGDSPFRYVLAWDPTDGFHIYHQSAWPAGWISTRLASYGSDKGKALSDLMRKCSFVGTGIVEGYQDGLFNVQPSPGEVATNG